MKALALRTRSRTAERDGEACLLVYDGDDVAPATVSADVREVLTYRPNTPWIYVLCPYLSKAIGHALVFGGFAMDRAGDHISLIHLEVGAEGCRVMHTASSDPDAASQELNRELIHGWLFDLFDSRGGLVKAPAGVHFEKLSGQHTDRFLRASNVLLTSTAIGAIAFFCQALIGDTHVQRVFVDTAPLIGVAFAMGHVAQASGFAPSSPQVESFSSYGGLHNLPPIGQRDLFLLSASTSGALASELVERNANPKLLVTLFLLGPPPSQESVGRIACNLTITPNRTFGYEPVVNAKADKCRFCAKGYLTAPLEGDQFLLEKRDVHRLRISQASQPKHARETMELLARRGFLAVELHASTPRTNVRLHLSEAINQSGEIQDRAVRLLRRFCPAPLDAVVLVDIEESDFRKLCEVAGMSPHIQNASIYPYENLGAMSPRDGARVLVMVGVLNDHAKVRNVNAQMRVKAPQGEVAYLSVLSVVDSALSYRELETFLTYGSRGQDTFTFKSALSLMLPSLDGVPSPWTQELELLQRMETDLMEDLDARLLARLVALRRAGIEGSGLFLDGKHGPLHIAADFVYLNTEKNIERVSQADVFAAVANLLATARCDNVGLVTAPGKLPGQVVRNQSVYGQSLVNPAALCPRNLRDYNDAILRAAFLRAAHQQELNYAVDAGCSAEVLAVFLAEVDAWDSGHGNAAPEILLALACGRLKLWPEHFERLVSHSRHVISDRWAQQLLNMATREATL